MSVTTVLDGIVLVNVDVVYSVEVAVPGTIAVTVVVLVTGVDAVFVHCNGVVQGTVVSLVQDVVHSVEKEEVYHEVSPESPLGTTS